eukprot:8142430-Lingulodinium_polyedra.AAC.1
MSATSAMACASIGRHRMKLPTGHSRTSLSWQGGTHATSEATAWFPSPSPVLRRTPSGRQCSTVG